MGCFIYPNPVQNCDIHLSGCSRGRQISALIPATQRTLRLAAVRYGDQLAIRDTSLTGWTSMGLLPLRPATKLNILAWKESLYEQIAGKAKKEFFDPLILWPRTRCAHQGDCRRKAMIRARNFLLRDKKPEFETWPQRGDERK